MRTREGGDGKRGCGAEGQALTAAFPAPTVPSPGAAVGWDSPAGRGLPSCSPPPHRCPAPGVGAGAGVPGWACSGTRRRVPDAAPQPAGGQRHPRDDAAARRGLAGGPAPLPGLRCSPPRRPVPARGAGLLPAHRYGESRAALGPPAPGGIAREGRAEVLPRGLG